jgi:hypothetical protein
MMQMFMRNHFKLLIVFVVAAVSAFVGFAGSSAETAKEFEAPELLNPFSFSYDGQAEKTAEQAYKNIQVFKGVPASQLLGAMNFMAGSLGVSCNHCHVPNQFAKDDKPAKQIARRHILLMRSVNETSFDGRTVVNCATCHRRERRPSSTLSVEQTSWPMPAMATATAKSAESLPTVEQTLDRYAQALGTRARFEKFKTLMMNGSRVITMGADPPSSEQLEVLRKAPNKLLMTFTSAGSKSTQAFNGTAGWRRNNSRVSPIGGVDLVGARRDADFYKDINFREQYPLMTVLGKESVSGREAYVIEATLPETSPARTMFGIQTEKLYFDVQSALLLRRYMEYKTLLGQLPEATDYADYKKVKGFMFPFTIRLTRPPLTAIQKFTEIKIDEPINDEMFDMPPAK